MVNQDSRKESDFLQYIDIIRDFCADVSQRKIAELFQVTEAVQQLPNNQQIIFPAQI